jgi:hypothetical protein
VANAIAEFVPTQSALTSSMSTPTTEPPGATSRAISNETSPPPPQPMSMQRMLRGSYRCVFGWDVPVKIWPADPEAVAREAALGP